MTLLMADILIALLIALQVADYWTTRRIIEGGGREVNVVLLYWRDLLDRLGVPGEFTWLWTPKVAVCLFVVIARIGGGFSTIPDQLGLAVVIVFYGYVVAKNYRVMMILKGSRHG